jgi:tetratricopeptide (TPR) repeat protein
MSQPPLPSQTATLKVGDKIDKYEILAQIGAGGVSVVWKAIDRFLGRHVAVKQVLFESRDGQADMAAKFRQEAQIQKRVATNQKHLVHVIDLIEEPRGLFLILEYVEGQSLEQLLSRETSPMDSRQALGLIGGIALGLEAIHKQDVVHRDLKPSNVLLPSGGGLKIGDFGLATLIQEQESLSLGSVRYMAPELFRDEPVDARADIYSLGMIAYEMLAGRAKFDEAFKLVLRDQRNQSLRWMKWHTNPRAKAPPLSQLVPSISPTLSELVERMIDKEPARRVASASELLDAIRRNFAPGAQPRAATAETSPNAAALAAAAEPHEVTAPIPRRSKWPVYLACALGAQVLLVVVYLAWYTVNQNQQAAARLSAANAQFKAGRDDIQAARWDEAVQKFDALASDWPNDSVFGNGSRARSLFARARKALDEREYASARDLLEQADKLGVLDPAIIQKHRDEVSKAMGFGSVLAEIEGFIAKQQFGMARGKLNEQLKRALTKDERKLIDDLGTRLEDAMAQQEIATALEEAQRLVDAGSRDKAIKRLADEQKRNSDPRLKELFDQLNFATQLDSLLQQAAAAEAKGDVTGAVNAYRKAISLKKNDPELEKRISLLRGNVALAEGRRALAAKDVRAAEAAFTSALGFGDFPEAREALANIKSANQRDLFVQSGDQAATLGDLENAVNQYNNALKLGAGTDVADKLKKIQSKQNVRAGRDALRKGDLDAAKASFNAALSLVPDDADAKKGLSDLSRMALYRVKLAAGDALRSQSRLPEAKQEYLKAREQVGTDEIAQRIEGVEYDSLIASAKRDIAAANWPSARAWLMTAKGIRDNEQVQELLKKVNLQMPAGNP